MQKANYSATQSKNGAGERRPDLTDPVPLTRRLAGVEFCAQPISRLPGRIPCANLSRLRRVDTTCPRSGSPACAEPVSQPSGRLSGLPGWFGKDRQIWGEN